jgi:hypothetical protein
LQALSRPPGSWLCDRGRRNRLFNASKKIRNPFEHCFWLS